MSFSANAPRQGSVHARWPRIEALLPDAVVGDDIADGSLLHFGDLEGVDLFYGAPVAAPW
jgi:hypothetical protein